MIVNNGCLAWKCSKWYQKVDFMDTTMNIAGNKTKTNIFEKSWLYTLISLHNHAILQMVLEVC